MRVSRRKQAVEILAGSEEEDSGDISPPFDDGTRAAAAAEELELEQYAELSVADPIAVADLEEFVLPPVADPTTEEIIEEQAQAHRNKVDAHIEAMKLLLQVSLVGKTFTDVKWNASLPVERDQYSKSTVVVSDPETGMRFEVRHAKDYNYKDIREIFAMIPKHEQVQSSKHFHTSYSHKSAIRINTEADLQRYCARFQDSEKIRRKFEEAKRFHDEARRTGRPFAYYPD